jgi:uncharacterized membrane protein YphA (DoxX/SURF4 family)
MKKNEILTWTLTSLRVVLGWYFLYEGIDKLMTPGWTSQVYLVNSRWIFADIFHQMSENPVVMKLVDLLNIWGLILIGLSLFIGLLVRWSSIAGVFLLLFYFVAYPPIPGYTFGTVAEGSYIWVSKTLILVFILLVFIALPADIWYGLDRLIKRWKNEKPEAPIPAEKTEETFLERREVLRDLISLPVVGAFAYAVYRKRKWDSFEEKFLEDNLDAKSGATLKSFNFASLKDLKGQVPKGKIGNMELSRLIAGGNLIGGWSHARDLIYASSLVKAYHTDERIMMTLQQAERCGINTILTTPPLARIINKYWHETGGKIQFISDCGGGGKDGLLGGVRLSEEGGASAMYCHGGVSDRLVQDGKFDEIVKALELIRSYGKPAGIGGHLLQTIRGCVEQGIKPDFWVKTLHHHNYWSAQVDTERKTTVDTDYKDNIFCFEPQETIEYMNTLEQPWIAFKILAAGAIQPGDGIKYAFENGADFVCVGMYDFQIVEDSNIVVDVLNSDFQSKRERRWLA